MPPPQQEAGPKWNWGERPPQVYCLLIAIVLMPPVILFASTQMAALLLLTGGLLLITNPVSGLGPLRSQPYLIPIVAVMGLGAVSGLWAVEEAETAKRFWRLVGFVAFGVLALTHCRELREKDQALLGRVLVPAFWVLLVFFLFERFSDKALTQLVTDHSEAERYAILNRPGTLMLLLSWPVAGFLFFRKQALHAFLVLLAAGLTQVGGQGLVVLLAWIIGGTAAALGAMAPRVTAVFLGVVMGVGIFIAPFVATSDSLQKGVAQSLPISAKSLRHRLLIWDFTGYHVAERPLAGWGLASSRAIPDADATALSYATETEVTWLKQGDPGILGRTPILPLHPHNAFLQIWLELGFLGAACAAAFVWYCARACRDGPPGVRACRFGLMATAITIACFSYGVWQSWWIASLFLIAALSAAIPDKVRRD